MEIDRTKIDELLDQPATGSNGMLTKIGGPRLGDQADLSDVDAGSVPSSTPKDDVGDGAEDTEPKVPKSRFRARERELLEERHQRELLAAQMETMKAEMETLRVQTVRNHATDELPEWWKTLYGDSEQSHTGYNLHQQGLTQSREELRTQLREDMQREDKQRQERERDFSDSIDTSIEELEAELGKTLSDTQRVAVLDIADEYTPKDADGNFLGPLMDLDAAYEIYQLKESTKGNRQGRDRVARIASASSQGETTTTPPSSGRPEWGSWRDRLGG